MTVAVMSVVASGPFAGVPAVFDLGLAGVGVEDDAFQSRQRHEALSPCPVQWGMTPRQALAHIDEDVIKTYVPGEFVNRLK